MSCEYSLLEKKFIKKMVRERGGVSLDVEFSRTTQGELKGVLLSMYDPKKKICSPDNLRIKHEIVLDYPTRNIAGIKNQDFLSSGIQESAVEEMMLRKIAGRVVVIHASVTPQGDDKKDFTSVGIDPSKLLYINTERIFTKKNPDGTKNPVSLRRLVRFFYKDEDFQSGVHNSCTDAHYTWRLFEEHFLLSDGYMECDKIS